MQIDGMNILAIEDGARLRLEWEIAGEADGGEKAMRALAFASGRMLREAAVVAAEPNTGKVFLWQDVPADTPEAQLEMFFERFMASCDWWREACGDAPADAGGGRAIDDAMFIRP